MSGPLGMPGAVMTSSTSLVSQGINFSSYHGITQFNGTNAAQITGGVGAIDGLFIYGYAGVALGYTHGMGTSAGVLSAALKTNGPNVNIAGLLTVPTINATAITATTNINAASLNVGTGESKFWSGTYSDPHVGGGYAIKVGAGGIAINGISRFNSNLEVFAALSVGVVTSGTPNYLHLNGHADSRYSIQFNESGAIRWRFIKESTAGGSGFFLYNHTSAGSTIDTPFNIADGVNGSVSIGNTTRNVNLNGPVFLNTKAGNKVLISNADKSIGESSVTPTQLGYLSTVTSDVQTQINNKMNTDGSNASTSVKIAAAAESNAITTVQYAGSTITANAPQAGAALRSAIKFDWYATNWSIGNIRGGSTDTAGFGIALSGGSNLRWRITSGTTYDYNNLIVAGTITGTTIYEGAQTLASKYLGITAYANGAYFLNKNTTFKYSGESGIQYYDADMTPVGTSANYNGFQGPTSAWYQVIHMPLSVVGYFNELLFPVNDTAGLWWRQRRNTSYYGWFKILDSQNYMTYALPLTGGTIAGSVQILAGSEGWGEGVRVVRGLDTWAGFRLTSVNDSTSRNGNWALGYCADSTGNFVFAGYTGTVQNNVMRIKQAGGVDILGEFTSSGLKLGYYSNTTYSGIWNTSVTKGDNNWAFLTQNANAQTFLNASTSLELQIFNGTSRNTRLQVTDTNINFSAHLIGSTSYNMGTTSNWWGSGYFTALYDNNYRVWSQQSHPTTLAGYYISDAVNTTNGVVGVTLANSSSFAANFCQDIFGTTATGYYLREVRTGASAPASLLGNYGSGLAWKGADTFGSLMVAYDNPTIRFTGGNGSSPVWTVDIWHSGNLPSPQPLIPASNSNNFYRGDKSWSNALTTNYYSVGSGNGYQFFNGGGYTEWSMRQLAGGDDSCVISSFASGSFTGDWIRLDKRNSLITLNSTTLIGGNLSANYGYYNRIYFNSSCQNGIYFPSGDASLTWMGNTGSLSIYQISNTGAGALYLGYGTGNYIAATNSTTIGMYGAGNMELKVPGNMLLRCDSGTISLYAGGQINITNASSMTLAAGSLFSVTANTNMLYGNLYNFGSEATFGSNTLVVTSASYSAKIGGYTGYYANIFQGGAGAAWINYGTYGRAGIGYYNGYCIDSTNGRLALGVGIGSMAMDITSASSAEHLIQFYSRFKLAGLSIGATVTATNGYQGKLIDLSSHILYLNPNGVSAGFWCFVAGQGTIGSNATYYFRGANINAGATVSFNGCCIAYYNGVYFTIG